MVDGSGQVKGKFLTSNPPPCQTTWTIQHRAPNFSTKRLWLQSHIWSYYQRRHGRIGQVRVPVCGQEGDHRFHSQVISNTPHIVLLFQPEFCSDSSLILVLLSTKVHESFEAAYRYRWFRRVEARQATQRRVLRSMCTTSRSPNIYSQRTPSCFTLFTRIHPCNLCKELGLILSACFTTEGRTTKLTHCYSLSGTLSTITS